ncbi:hypothetical protein HID58_048583, partial [Brassica napus]
MPTYQFRCRSPFTIGARNFLAEGVTEEQHMAVVLDMIRGKEFVCSQHAMDEIFEEDEIVLLYHFSMEIEKAKNNLDLNLGPTVETGDGLRAATANVYVVTGFNFPGFHQVLTGGRFRTSVPSPTYDLHYYTPHFGAMEDSPEYLESLMSSSYVVQLQRIYRVPGSEYVGYAPTDLNIGATNVPPIPRNQQLIDVSSNGSSTDVKTIVETWAEVNFSKMEPTCYGNFVYVEKDMNFACSNGYYVNQYIQITKIRESSKHGNLGPAAHLAGVMNTENIQQSPEAEGNNGGDA